MAEKLKITPGNWTTAPVPITEIIAGIGHFKGYDPDLWYVRATRQDEENRRVISHIATVNRCGRMSDEELEANARAIASLPALIKAAKQAEKALTRVIGNGPGPNAYDALDALRSVLTRIQGGDGNG